MQTYRTKLWGTAIEFTADFSQASCPIHGDPHGRQVADFRHWPREAMQCLLQEFAMSCGADPEDEEVAYLIDDAVDDMTEEDSQNC
jgi:hypothetical protein